MSAYFSRLSRLIELSEATAVIHYIMAPPSLQEILKTKYIQLIKTGVPEAFTADTADYSEEERERTQSVCNTPTLDQIMDDPRRGQGGKY